MPRACELVAGCSASLGSNDRLATPAGATCNPSDTLQVADAPRAHSELNPDASGAITDHRPFTFKPGGSGAATHTEVVQYGAPARPDYRKHRVAKRDASRKALGR